MTNAYGPHPQPLDFVRRRRPNNGRGEHRKNATPLKPHTTDQAPTPQPPPPTLGEGGFCSGFLSLPQCWGRGWGGGRFLLVCGLRGVA